MFLRRSQLWRAGKVAVMINSVRNKCSLSTVHMFLKLSTQVGKIFCTDFRQ